MLALQILGTLVLVAMAGCGSAFGLLMYHSADHSRGEHAYGWLAFKDVTIVFCALLILFSPIIVLALIAGGIVDSFFNLIRFSMYEIRDIYRCIVFTFKDCW